MTRRLARTAPLAAAPAAPAAGAPIPLRPPTGDRDSCGGGGRGAPQALWRPLALPLLPPGSPCPAATPHVVTPRAAPVLGGGQVFFAAGAYDAADRARMVAREVGQASGTGRGSAKAPVLMPAGLRQPLVPRRRIDGPGELGSYALQVDGATFSRAIAFRVELA